MRPEELNHIEFEMLDEHIARMVVNRQSVRNALNWEAMEEFGLILKSIRSSTEIRVVLITGAGEAFISGADLRMVSSLDSSREAGERLSSKMGEVLAEFRRLPVISIAVVNGPARGGGAEIAVSCDIRLMSSSASIGFVQTSLGLIPGWGGASRLFSLVGYARALEFIATGRVIEAEEALRVGLVNAVHLEDELNEKAFGLAGMISKNSWEAVRAVKSLLLDWESDEIEQRRLAEREVFLDLWQREEREKIFAAFRRFENDH